MASVLLRVMTALGTHPSKDFFAFLRLVALIATAILVVSTGAFALHETPAVFWRIMGSAGAVSLVSAAIGTLVGFLFGIPRTLQSNDLGDGSTRHLPNTSLEQISDWLTKIIVGVGLVQIGRLPDALGALGATLAPLFGTQPGAATFAVALSGAAGIAGLIISYLWTRVLLTPALDGAYTQTSSTAQMPM